MPHCFRLNELLGCCAWLLGSADIAVFTSYNDGPASLVEPLQQFSNVGRLNSSSSNPTFVHERGEL